MIKLLVVDDNMAVCHALEARLSRVPDFDLAGCVGNTDDALEKVQRLQPDVVLFESKRRDGMGLHFCQRVLEMDNSPEMIVLTSFLDDTERLVASSIGVHRYVLKDIATSALIQEIHDAYRERCERAH